MSVANGLLVTGILLDLIEAATRIATLLQTVQAEGRDITDEEMAALQQQRRDAWARLEAANDVGPPANSA